MIPRVPLAIACLAAVVLPIALAVLYGVSSLLGSLGDASGALAISRMALVCGILWGVDLVCLVLMLGVNAVMAAERAQPTVEADSELENPPHENE